MAIRNAIQMLDRVGELLDRVKSPRYSDTTYMNNINDAITMIVKNRIDSIKQPRTYSIQSAQRVRDELYTLIPAAATGSVSSDVVAYPSSYLSYLLLYVTIDGVKQFCTPASYGDIAELKENPFRAPSTTKPYYNEFVSGLKIDKGSSGTYGSYELYYVKHPDVVTIGKESDKRTSTTGVSATTQYMCYEEAVYSAVTYYPGDVFTTTGTTTLTSGIVIPTSVITSSNMPENMQNEICQQAAELMSGQVGDAGKYQVLERGVEKS